jgi:hypothetical protein
VLNKFQNEQMTLSINNVPELLNSSNRPAGPEYSLLLAAWSDYFRHDSPNPRIPDSPIPRIPESPIMKSSRRSVPRVTSAFVLHFTVLMPF